MKNYVGLKTVRHRDKKLDKGLRDNLAKCFGKASLIFKGGAIPGKVPRDLKALEALIKAKVIGEA